MKTTAGLLLVIIACLVVSMLGYHAYEGFTEGAGAPATKPNTKTITKSNTKSKTTVNKSDKSKKSS